MRATMDWPAKPLLPLGVGNATTPSPAGVLPGHRGLAWSRKALFARARWELKRAGSRVVRSRAASARLADSERPFESLLLYLRCRHVGLLERCLPARCEAII